MNPLHLIAAALLLATVICIVVGVLLHQRAQLAHEAANRLTVGDKAAISSAFEKAFKKLDEQMTALETKVTAHGNELVAIDNRRAR